MLIGVGTVGMAYCILAGAMTGSLWWSLPSCVFGMVVGNRLAALWLARR